MSKLGMSFETPKLALKAATKLLGDLPRRMSRSRESDAVMRGLAEFAQERLQQGILGGRPGWPALSEMTKELKGHGKPLVDTGEFVKGITTWKDGQAWAAGIPPEEEELRRIGEVHENGAHVRVTDAMRRFFAARGFPLRKSTSYIRIPARPWFAPAVAEVHKHALAEIARLRDRLAKDTERDLMRVAGREAARIQSRSRSA